MKKSLFVLLITTITLTGFRKSDDSIVSFNGDNSKAIDLSIKNTSTASWSVTADTTKKGGGRRGDEIPYRGTGGKVEAPKKDPGGNGGKGGTPKKETGGGNGGAGKEGNVKKDTDGDNKTEAVIFRQQKNK